jgi:uncharacterized membrane protein YjgN (DUF898 family)
MTTYKHKRKRHTMETVKPLEFKGTAGGYFVLALISIILMYIPILGWAFLLNYASNWYADNALVNGKKVAYKASYGESLKFIFVNSLLLIVTLGIYMFWFVPKMYRYAFEHIHYIEEIPVTQPVEAPIAPASVNPVDPVAPATAAAPTIPDTSVDPTSPVAPTGTTPLAG